MSVEAQSQHFQSQAVTMLVMATGAIGFGLFGTEFRVSTELLPTMKFGAGGLVLVFYVMLVRSVRNILESSEVTGRDVVAGPLFHMFLVVLYVVFIFVVDIFDDSVGSP